jgi:hypothetical protein
LNTKKLFFVIQKMNSAFRKAIAINEVGSIDTIPKKY